MTIGIIEDDTLLHQALKTALQNAGYQTVSAYTKQEALTTITGSESLLLIDIGLPDGNGLACYKKIREKAEIPAIFLTARDEETDMLTAFATLRITIPSASGAGFRISSSNKSSISSMPFCTIDGYHITSDRIPSNYSLHISVNASYRYLTG